MAIKIIFIFMSLCAFSAYGDEIYKWIDENGRVQYGNTVPVDMQEMASKVDANRAQLIDRQHFEPKRPKAHNEEESTKNNNTSPVSSPADSQAEVVPEPVAGSTKAKDKKKQCEEEWAKYWASLECFAPYRNVNRSVKAEAFEQCEEIKQPLEFCD